tara:strand:+ start:911 stop:1600 length:690 start_codon:yes stop_codon:yes gene_type:complete
MLGNKWIIDLEPHFNVDEIKALDYEICMGIALSEHYLPTPGVKSQNLEYPPSKFEYEYKTQFPDWYESLTTYQRRMFMRVYDRACLPVRAIYVKKQDDYTKKHLDSHSKFTKNAKHFPKLINFIDNIPFKEYGRIEIFVCDPNNGVPEHLDAIDEEDPNREPGDFIWFTPRGNDKKFYVKDDTEHKHYASHISWFNERDIHGSDPVPYSTYSIRVDGIFEEEFRKNCLM